MIKGIVLNLLLAVSAFAQTGNYQIEKSVIASGGGTSSGGSYSLEGTSGQPLAGGILYSGSFQLFSGFWTPAPLAPTAAPVTISGRVVNRYGRGISGVILSLTDAEGNSRRAITSAFGYY